MFHSEMVFVSSLVFRNMSTFITNHFFFFVIIIVMGSHIFGRFATNVTNGGFFNWSLLWNRFGSFPNFFKVSFVMVDKEFFFVIKHVMTFCTFVLLDSVMLFFQMFQVLEVRLQSFIALWTLIIMDTTSNITVGMLLKFLSVKGSKPAKDAFQLP